MDGLKTYLAEMQEKYDELTAKTESAKQMRHEVFLKAGSVEYARQFGMLRYLAEWTDFLIDLPDWINNMIETELEKTESRTDFNCEHCGDSYDWFVANGSNDCCEKNWELYGELDA